MNEAIGRMGRGAACAVLALSAGCMTVPLETAGDPAYPGGPVAGPAYPDGRDPYRPPVRDTAYGPPVYSPGRPADAGVADDSALYYPIDSADGLARAIGSAPPDFAFRFDGRTAYAWVSSAGEAMIVEPAPGGVIQYFYAAHAAAPYLVRDVYAAYAFDGQEPIARYDGEGRLVRARMGPQSWDEATRLHERGVRIMAASYQRRWDGEVAGGYLSQSFIGFSFGDHDSGWSGGWRPHWRDRRDWQEVRRRRGERAGQREERRNLEAERRRRAESAQRFDGWRRGGRCGPPPAAGVDDAAPAAPPRSGGRGGRTDAAPTATPMVPNPGTGPAAPVVTEPPRETPRETPRPRRPARDAGGFRAAPEVTEREVVADSTTAPQATPSDEAAAAAARAAELSRSEAEQALARQRAGEARAQEAQGEAVAAAARQAEAEAQDRRRATEQAESDAAARRAQAEAAARAQAEQQEQARAEARARQQEQARADARARAEADARAEAQARENGRAQAAAEARAQAQDEERAERARARAAEGENGAERPD